MTSASLWLASVQAAARRHPRRLTAAVLALLGGFAATAFGIAPLAPDAATLPKRVLVETMQLEGLAVQLDELASHPLQLNRHDVTRPSDTVDGLFKRLGVVDPTAANFLRTDPLARRLVDGQGQKMVQVSTASDGTLLELVARFPALDSARISSHFTRLTLRRGELGHWRSTLETAELVPQTRLGSGTIRSSLWAATDDAELPDAIARQLIEIFSADVDFHRQLHRGDSFSVVFEALTADDQTITWNDATGRILAAEFVNNGKSLKAVWFQEPGKAKGGYFSPAGKSLQRSFLASPLEFSRVTSGFATRFHPILQNWRAHNGVDYSAPMGTAVRSVSDGTVEFAGRQSGYGNVVQVQHNGGRSTLYAHLSRMDVQVGQRVDQGQVIGAVGATGWATGPHLHFEFRVNGVFQDPLMLTAGGDHLALTPAALPIFASISRTSTLQLDAAQTMIGYRGNAE